MEVDASLYFSSIFFFTVFQDVERIKNKSNFDP